MTVIDPAMGSGHFCLGAARRIAMRLATIRSYGASPSPEQFRHALREVIDHCIYGVDLNPLAVELARMALWLEGYEEGKPLSFLDHHLKVGNSLVGVFSYDMLKQGISPAAFTAKRGDDKHVTAVLNKINDVGIKYLSEKDKEIDSILHVKGTNGWLLDTVDPLTYINAFRDIEQTSTDTVDAVMRKQEAYDTLLNSPQLQVQRDRCDLLIAAYMAPKNKQTQDLVPTSYTLGQVLFDDERYDEFNRASIDEQIAFARKVCKDASVFHWPVEFPLVMNDGGFTVVLGNPPWDKPKVEDVKWFASRYPEIANAPTAAVRKKMIEKLSHGLLASSHLKDGALLPPNKAEIKLYEQYIEALRTAACAAKFGHLEAEFGGRFPLTGVGDTNLFAYFAELALSLNNDKGRIGMVLPTILMTGDTTKVFAAHVLNGNMIQLHDFENRKKIFPIDSRFRFSLITIGKSDDMDCVFYATSQKDLDERHRHIAFTPSDIRMMSPNTKTCINIRSHRDLEINRKIYSKVPILWLENPNGDDVKSWDISFLRMFDGSNDSALFKKERFEGAVPLYIGKFISNFDDRFETFDLEKNGKKVNRYVSENEKTNSYEINPEYWVDHKDVNEQWLKKGYNNPWVLGFRDVASPTNERTLITSVVNASFAFSNKLPLVLLNKNDTRLAACLMANFNSLVTDYLVRIKAPSSNVNFFILKQTPILPPDTYSEKEIEFIASRVAKLTRNHESINKVWLTDYPEYTFGTDESRLETRAELDAIYARKYGLTRDELEFVLDPSEAESPEYPSVTFPGLKKNEIKLYGEFRTRRLVLEAFDKLEKYGLEAFEVAN